MKKLFLSLILWAAMSLQAQIEYPRYEKDSLGQTVVVLTVEQAQALDNATDLLLLFEKLNSQIANYDSVCIKVVKEKDEVIAQQTIMIDDLKSTLAIKDQQIENLKTTILKKNTEIKNLEDQLKIEEEKNNLCNKEVKRLKTKMTFGGSFGGIAIVALLLGILL